MLHTNPFPPGALALAVLAAGAQPARGEDKPRTSLFPDTQRADAAAIFDEVRTGDAHLTNAGLLEISRSFGDAALSLSMSQTRESNAYLGSRASTISRARGNAFSFALVAVDRIRHGDRLGLSLSQPMRTYAGRIEMDVLSRSDGSGRAGERLVFSMVPVGREMRAQLSYTAPAGYGATFGVTLVVRRNPNNLADAPAEALIAMRYVKAF